jgi:hypothetical protein
VPRGTGEGVTAPVELPLAGPAPAARAVAANSPERYRELARRVRLLSWLSLGAMSVEGVVALVAGVMAGSIALVGFGLDSAIEGCAYLAGALLVGLAGNAIAGAWWLDPVVGLLIAGVAVKEGREAWHGEGCCVGSPLDGFADDACNDDCCH